MLQLLSENKGECRVVTLRRAFPNAYTLEDGVAEKTKGGVGRGVFTGKTCSKSWASPDPTFLVKVHTFITKQCTRLLQGGCCLHNTSHFFKVTRIVVP